MRRYILTPLLAATALLAAWAAPRLFTPAPPPAPMPAVVDTGRVATPAVLPPAPLPAVHPVEVAQPTPPPPRAVPPRAARPAPPPSRPARPRPASDDLLIPELDDPFHVPVTIHPPPPEVQTPEIPEHFWEDCPGCGMG